MKDNIVIEIKNLKKYYGESRGIESVNLQINKGEIFGLLGPNGSGKTTTIRVLLDLIRKTSGEARVFGMDIFTDSVKIRERVAYLPGELGLYENKTARQNLRLLLGMYHKPVPERRIEELAERFALDLDRKVEDLSKGNKQKVGIVLVLAPDVDLLVLDEPTSSLDPLIMAKFYNVLHEQQKKTSTTVLLSSHRLEEVERVADRVGIIREGRIVEVETIDHLKKMALKDVIVELPDKEQVSKLKSLVSDGILEGKKNDLKETQASFMVARDQLPKFFKVLSEMPLVDVDISSPALETIFLKYYEMRKTSEGS